MIRKIKIEVEHNFNLLIDKNVGIYLNVKRKKVRCYNLKVI